MTRCLPNFIRVEMGGDLFCGDEYCINISNVKEHIIDGRTLWRFFQPHPNST